MKIWRNRAILFIVIAAIALTIFAIQYYGVYDIKAAIWSTKQDDPVALLEESGVVDVIYFGVGEYESNLLGKTPVFALGIIYYPPGPKGIDAQYHVELTDQGWNIIRERYDWNSDLEESYHDKIHRWNFEKLYYYGENALFRPGESGRVNEAMLDLLDYVEEKVFREWLYTVFVIAEQQEIEWRIIEIDFVKPVGFINLEEPTPLFGYTEETGPTYVMGMWPELQGTYQIFRARTKDDVKHYVIKEIVGAGELTSEAWTDLLETGQMQVVPMRTVFGSRRYGKGFNHPWMGRELEGKT